MNLRVLGTQERRAQDACEVLAVEEDDKDDKGDGEKVGGEAAFAVGKRGLHQGRGVNGMAA